MVDRGPSVDIKNRWNERSRERLARVRLMRGETLQEFADWFGVSIHTINCWGSRAKCRVPGWAIEQCLDYEIASVRKSSKRA